jgi:hypothetical protein
VGSPRSILIHSPYVRRPGSGVIPPLALCYLASSLAAVGGNPLILDLAARFPRYEREGIGSVTETLAEPTPVVIATVEDKHYLVSMLGPGSDWVKNVEAAHGDAVIRQGRRRPVPLVAVPPEHRAPTQRVR